MPQLKLQDLCQELANLYASPIVSIILPKEPILPPHLIKLNDLIGEKKCQKINVILHSSGGDINTAYQMIELLRSHCDDMTIIVPLYAKSAATLFILGSNRIVMGELAEFGPLDTQIAEREKGGRKYTSALNPFKTLEELQRFALETVDVTAKFMLLRADLSVEEAIEHSIDLASRISTPLLSQLNTEKVGVYSRALMVGQEYGERLLRRYSKFQDKTQRNILLERLIRGYPSHDYIIDYKELIELGFEVKVPSGDEKRMVDNLMKYVIMAKDTDILMVENTPPS